MHWYVDVLKKYAVFTGRAGRAEFWMFTLFSVLISLALAVIDTALGTKPLLGVLYSLAVLLPSLAVGVRRLHDTNRTGWWILIALVPIIGGIILLVFLALPGTPGDNSYGPRPQEVPLR
ncbi:DUF805 domain-containing protein [Streptomyces sp. NPDC001407]|uniref:DUF805 domain-containing protein n=1 Tax=unclassified Streptomyces TaxID=2593676 RepID=UPI0033DE615B